MIAATLVKYDDEHWQSTSSFSKLTRICKSLGVVILGIYLNLAANFSLFFFPSSSSSSLGPGG
jgi:hypothetical protein